MPFIDYIPVTQTGYSGKGATTASSSGKKDSEDLIGKSIQKALEQNGLESDVEVFAQYAEAILQNNMYGFNDGGLNGSVAQLFKLRSLANKVRNSNELYETALSHMKSADTSSDYAVSSDGKVYALFQDDEGNAKVDTIKLDTYKENSDKYRLITNSELLEYRRLNKAFDDSMLQDIIGSIGMEEIVSDINNVISKFGKRTTSSYPNLSESVAKGMEYLFKINIEASAAYQDIVEDGEKKKDISAAIKYIYSSLNNNAKNVLKLHAELNDTSVVDYLKDAITLNTSYEYKEDIEKAPKGIGSGSGSGSKEQLGAESWEHAVFKRHGRPQSVGMILEGRTKFGFKGVRFDMIKGPDGKDVKPITSGIESYNNLQNRGLVATGQTVYFGNLPLDNISAQGMDLIVDNSDGLAIAYLPTDKSGNLDFSMMQQMSKIQEAIDNERISDPNKKAQYWEKYGFKYNKEQDTGVPHDRELKPFIVQNAYTTEATNSFADPVKGASPLSGNLFFEKIDASIVDQMLAQYNRTAQKGEKLDWGSGWFTDSYRGTIYIPMNDQELQSMISGGEAYSPKLNSNMIKAQQDATRLTGGYNYNTGSFDRTLKGTSDEDLN